MEMKDKKRYIGHLSQIFEVKEYRLSGGRADGMRAVDVDNGSGLVFTALPDRCLDIGKISLHGQTLSFLSPCGYVAPPYYDCHGLEWLRSFTAGFLTTCGFSNIGNPSEDAGEALGAHGRLSSLPAEQFSARVRDDGTEPPEAVLSGVMRHAVIFRENLLLTRKIRCRHGENRITLEDTVENIGAEPAPLMRLYHFNIGYPLLDENAELLIPTRSVIPRDSHAETGLDRWNRMETPVPGFREMCYYHQMRTDEKGRSAAGVYQPARGVGAVIRYDTATLDRFLEWKMMSAGNYVLGLEPCNATLEGRAEARADGSLKFLAPGERLHSRFELQFVSGAQEWESFRHEIESYR